MPDVSYIFKWRALYQCTLDQVLKLFAYKLVGRLLEEEVDVGEEFHQVRQSESGRRPVRSHRVLRWGKIRDPASEHFDEGCAWCEILAGQRIGTRNHEEMDIDEPGDDGGILRVDKRRGFGKNSHHRFLE